MPELPEVETVRREILPHVKGRTIIKIEFLDKRNIKNFSVKKFVARVVGQKILDIERRAKYLLFKLKSGNFMVVHLGMAGRVLLKPDKYIRIIFYLSGNKKFYFSDTRMFGKIWLYNRRPELNLGIEPFSKEFTPEKLKEMFGRKKGKAKIVLMDQKFIAGVGNIYAAEALFEAGIHPNRRVETFTDLEIKKLHQAVLKVLRAGIAHKGSSVDNFVDAIGKQGTHQNYLNVYDRKGQPCKRCKGTVQKISLGQRGTYFCPNCQR